VNSKMRRFNKSASSESAKPDQVLASLGIKRGMNVLEIGVGGGYFISRIAVMVGESGLVYGVDTEPDFIANLVEMNTQSQYRNIRPVLFRTITDLLGLGKTIDLVFTRNAYHHLKDRAEYFRSISPLLKPECRIAIIDYNEYPFSLLRILGHFTRKKEIIREQAEAGNRLIQDVSIFQKQSFLIFQRE
jgi:arsenite methyltransferase